MSIHILKKGDTVRLRYPVSLKAYDIVDHRMLLGSVDTGENFWWPASAPPFNMPLMDWPIYLSKDHLTEDLTVKDEIELEQGKFWLFFPHNFGEEMDDTTGEVCSTYYAIPAYYERDSVRDDNLLTLDGIKMFSAQIENYSVHNDIIEKYRSACTRIRELDMKVHKVFAEDKDGEIATHINNDNTEDLDLDVFISHIHREATMDENRWSFCVIVKCDFSFIKLSIELLCIP